MHRLGGLVEEIDRIIKDEKTRYQEAQEYMSQLERIEVESVPNADIRLQMGVRQMDGQQEETPEPEEAHEGLIVLTAVNLLLSEAPVLLSESHGPTEEGEEAALEIKHAIADAGLILAKEQGRRERGMASQAAADANTTAAKDPPTAEEHEPESGAEHQSCA